MKEPLIRKIIIKKEKLNQLKENILSFAHDEKIASLFHNKNFMVTLYAILGTILLLLMWGVFNAHVMHLKVESSVVNVPIESIVSPTSGFINEILVKPGQYVKKGFPLVSIENLELEKDYQLEKIKIEESKQNILYIEKLLANEQQRLNVYKTVGADRLLSAQANEDISKQDLINIKNNLTRMQSLHKKHYISDVEWETQVTKYNNAKKSLQSSIAQKDIENASINSITKGLYFTGDKLEGTTGDLAAQLETAKIALKMSEEKVKVYKYILDKMQLPSPFDGKVIEVLKSSGSIVDTSKPIILLENTQEKKQIISYLTQNEILNIKTKNNVRIYIPSIEKTYHGKITDINRTNGFVDEMKSQFRWRDLDLDRSATVTIDIEPQDQSQFMHDTNAGMPAIVYFRRKFNL